jgi:hypothetical protein
MKLSRQEEVICALWTIAALLAFSNNFSVAGWLFLVKAVADFLYVLRFSIVEIKAERGILREDSSNEN